MTGEMGSKFVRRGEGTEKGKGWTGGKWYRREGQMWEGVTEGQKGKGWLFFITIGAVDAPGRPEHLCF